MNRFKFLIPICFLAGLTLTSVRALTKTQAAPQWTVLQTVPFKGKQDDIYFVNADIGWYVNGAGFIYKTTDGGATWAEQFHKPGTYFRAIGFVDEQHGFAGNIGPDYFPNVTDSTPLYETVDGGTTWTPVSQVTPQPVKGVCAIDILKTSFINAGHLDHRVTVRAAGRVGGPVSMATSRNGGLTWKTEDLSNVAGMILDVKFLNELTGFVCAASSSDIEVSHARILKTVDGGTSWKIVYESKRPFETTWKCAFPDEKTGYATIQSYDPAESNAARYVAKTTDGGETWSELRLADDHKVEEFGIGFIDSLTGWVGALKGGWFTQDGGVTWTAQALGTAVNKIRVVRTERGPVIYAIGVDVRKLDLRN